MESIQFTLGFGSDRSGNPVLLKLPRSVAKPGMVAHLASGGFVTLKAVANIDEGCHSVYAAFSQVYPIHTALEILVPIWRQQNGN